MCKKLVRLLAIFVFAGIFAVSCNETFAPEVDFGDKTYVNDYSTLVDQIKTIADRINLLNKILEENFEGIRISIDNNTNAIKAQTDKLSGDLGDVVATLFNGFSALNCKIDGLGQEINDLGEKIVYAINEQGEIIALRVKENGTLISSQIEANAADLLNVINSHFGSLASRFEALNEVIKVGLAEFVIDYSSSDELVAELKEISEILKSIDVSILNGFTTLNATQIENGKQIVYAINSAGYILAATLNYNGQLLSASIVCQTKELVKAINNASASLADRLDAINIALDANLASIAVNKNSENQALHLVLESVNDLLKGINIDFFDEFKMLSDTILENGNNIVKAINSNGDKVSFYIDNNGKLISASLDNVVESLEELVAILNSMEKSLAEKLEALTSAINCGVKGITCSLNQQTMTLSLKLDELECALFNGFTAVSNKIGENGCSVLWALNQNGQLISASIDRNGQLLAAEYRCTAKQIVDAINGKKVDFGDKIDALCTAVESGLASVNVTLGNIGGMLNMEFSNLNDALKDLKSGILEGFKLVGLTEFENGDKIAKAINDSGKMVAFTINKNGELISVKLDGVISGLEDLIAVLEDQNKCLEEKFNTLNKAVAEGYADITLAIEQQTRGLKLKLGEISSTLLDGFVTLKQTIADENGKLIYAINENGEIISLSIGQDGELMRATVAGLASDLVAAINNLTGNLGAKLKALTSVVETGLARIEIKIGAAGDELIVSLEDINDAIKDLDATVLDGFKLTGQYMFRTGDMIVRAINGSGEKIAASLDKNGNLIEVKLAGVIDSINDLVAAMADNKDSLNDKFDLLNKAIADGFEGISLSFNEAARTISLKLGDINSTLFDGFEGLKSVITTEGERLMYAVNTKGDLIALKIGENGALLSAALEGNTADIVRAINDQTTSLKDCIDYLNFMVQTGLANIEVKLGEVGGMLDVKLTDINKTLKGIKSGILEGFTVLGTQMVADNQLIVDAINNMGEKISLKINDYGYLIHLDLGDIAAAIRELVAYLESADNSIADKLDALNKGIQDKVGEITAAINGETGLISAALGNISLSFLNGFTTLNQKFDDLGRVIASAINTQGEGIILKIDEKGNLLNATMALGAEAICNALKDQNKSLADKLDALNDALAENFLGLSADLDAVTGAIKMNYNMLSKIDFDLDADLKALTDALRVGLDSIFDELVVLNTTAGQNGEQIVQALNANGDAIKLQIKASGELIEASLDDNTTALIAALKDQNTSLETKLEALGDLIKEGLANIVVKLGDIYTDLKVDLGALKDVIEKGFGDVTDGLTQLKTQMNADGTAIVNAITSKGDLIQGQIDASGKLIEAAIKANTKDLKEALEAQAEGASAIADKVDALNTTVQTGLGNIEAKIDAQTGAITTGYTDLSGKLGTIGTNILNGFNGAHTDLEAIKAAINGLKDQLTIDINANTEAILTLDGDFKAELGELVEAVEGIGGDIVLAINGQKEAIVLALGPDGAIVGAVSAGAVKIADSISAEMAKLIAALGDQNASLESKLDALTDAIKAGFGDIVVKLDAINNTIHVDLGALQEAASADLSAIKEALEDILGGLSTLNVTVGENGEQIVTALNANGEAIKLQIKSSGELIEASLDDNTTALIAALKDQNTSLETKLEALGDLIKEGLANIVVKLGDIYTDLKVDLGALKDVIEKGFGDVTDGLTQLKTQMNADGTAIVNAITSKGDLIQGQIDASGKLIEAAIKANTKDIKDALEAQATGAQAIADKVDALNTTVETGLGQIEAKIEAQTGAITTGYTDLSGKLGDINTNILEGFKGAQLDLEKIEAAIRGMKDTLNIAINANTDAILTLDDDLKTSFKALADSLSAIGGKLVLAIDGQNQAMALALGPDGAIAKAINAGTVKIADAIGIQTASLSALLNTGNDTLADILAALGTTGEDIASILEYMKDHEVDLTEIIKLLGINNHLLTELLAISDGVYLDSTKFITSGEFAGKYSAVYLTPEAREAADNSSETEIAIASLLAMEAQMTAPSKTQFVTQTYINGKLSSTAKYDYSESEKHGHSIWKRVRAYEGMIYSTGVTVTDSDNKTLVEVKARSTKEIWLIKIHEVCSFRMIYGIKKDDVDGLKYDYYAARYVNSDKQVTGPDPDYLVDGKKIADYTDMPSNEKDYSDTHKNYPSWYNGGATPIPVIFNIYNKETGEYIQPEAYIYCIQTGFSKSYKGTNTSSAWIGSGGNSAQLDDDNVWPADIQTYTNEWLAAHPDIR